MSQESSPAMQRRETSRSIARLTAKYFLLVATKLVIIAFSEKRTASGFFRIGDIFSSGCCNGIRFILSFKSVKDPSRLLIQQTMMHVAFKNTSLPSQAELSPIVRILAYFSLFNYPLLSTEIARFLPTPRTSAELEEELNLLVAEAAIYRIGSFYSVIANPAIAERRRLGNIRAAALMKKAVKIGKFLSAFPFVTGIAVSGSLSKNFAEENADIDFFIITTANRLWIARTLMHVFKKFTYLSGKQHLYCMNYYLDELALKIPEQNIYTAIETATLLPIAGNGMRKFHRANLWTSEWFHSYARQEEEFENVRRPILKRILEYLLNINYLDKLLYRFTTRRWKKKHAKGMLNQEGRRMNLESGRHFARSNPGFFQERILREYEMKLREISEDKSNSVSSM